MAFRGNIVELIENESINGVTQIPASWSRIPLKSIAKVINGFAFKSKHFNTSKGTPLIRIRDVLKGYSETFYEGEIPDGYWVERDDILVGMDGDFNTCRWCSEKALLNQRVCKIEVLDSNVYDSRFLFYLLPIYLKLINENTSATTVKHLSSKTLAELPIPNPSIDEQKRIADKLDSVLSKVEAAQARLDKIPAILKRFRESVLAAATSGELTKEWREDNEKSRVALSPEILEDQRFTLWCVEEEKKIVRKGKELNNFNWKKRYKPPTLQYEDIFDLTSIENVPSDWLKTTLDAATVIVTGKTPSTRDNTLWANDVPFTSPSQIKKDGVITTDGKWVSLEAVKSVPLLPKGATLIVCIGTIGKVGISSCETAFNQQINALIPASCINPKYLYFWCRTLHTWLNQTSSAVVNSAIINKSRLSKAPFAVPPKAEQDLIVLKVESLLQIAERVDTQYGCAQARLDKLTQSILAKAFKGELLSNSVDSDIEAIENSIEALNA
ncbi:Type-1 restriction enzyme EcoKI specificity protein [Alteromonas macleodii]